MPFLLEDAVTEIVERGLPIYDVRRRLPTDTPRLVQLFNVQRLLLPDAFSGPIPPPWDESTLNARLDDGSMSEQFIVEETGPPAEIIGWFGYVPHLGEVELTWYVLDLLATEAARLRAMRSMGLVCCTYFMRNGYTHGFGEPPVTGLALLGSRVLVIDNEEIADMGRDPITGNVLTKFWRVRLSKAVIIVEQQMSNNLVPGVDFPFFI